MAVHHLIAGLIDLFDENPVLIRAGADITVAKVYNFLLKINNEFN